MSEINCPPLNQGWVCPKCGKVRSVSEISYSMLMNHGWICSQCRKVFASTTPMDWYCVPAYQPTATSNTMSAGELMVYI